MIRQDAFDSVSDPECYRVHLYVYGKLIQGSRDYRGPIKPNTDHRMTARSAGFPDALQVYCAPDRFVRNWQGANSVDARTRPGGAFLYRPVHVGDHLYGLFARIQSRPENGEGKPGRSYSHCAVLAVEDRWEPALIPMMATLLFDETGPCLGTPNHEGQLNRLNMPLEPLLRSDVQAAFARELPEDAHPIVDLSREWAMQLEDEDLAVNGRWLPFAFGGKPALAAPTARFYATDTGTGDGLAIESGRLPFRDSHPPEVRPQPDLQGEIDASRFFLSSTSPARARVVRGRLFPGAAQLWPDQAAAMQGHVTETPTGRLAEPDPGVSDDPIFDFADLAAPDTAMTWPGEGRPDLAAPDAVQSSPLARLTSYLQGLRWQTPGDKAFAETVDLDKVAAARTYLAGRLLALSAPHFTRYRFLDEDDSRVLCAVQGLLCLSMRVACIEDLDEYAQLLGNSVLAMPAFPELRVPAAGIGSPFSYLVFALHSYVQEGKHPRPLDAWFRGDRPFPQRPGGNLRPDIPIQRLAGFAASLQGSVQTVCPFPNDALGVWWSRLSIHARNAPIWLREPRWLDHPAG